MSAALAIGFLLGLRHACESDHLATVAALATRASSLRQTVRVAGAWGAGHAAALLAAGLLAAAFEARLPAHGAALADAVVGATLVLLGAGALRRARRLHVHAHRHADGRRHWHVHAHDTDEARHDAERHDHAHARRLLPRAALLGGLHGVAGSAAVTLLAVQTLPSVHAALLYLALFGLGSVLGMVACSVAIALPLRWSAGTAGAALRTLELAVGGVTLGLGCWIVAGAAAGPG